MVKITCGVCEKLLSIDETKLPMKEVTFPCPLCKSKVELDRRKLDPDIPGTLRAKPAGAGASAAKPPPPASEGEVGAAADFKTVDGGGETGRKALVVGKVTDEIANAARSVGYNPVHIEDLEQARDWYLQEFPGLVILNPGDVGNPPSEAVGKFGAMSAVDRRRSFFVLVGDNLKTLDGNAAFLFGVNMVVAPKDLGQFDKIYTEARRDHNRLVQGLPGAEALAM